MAYFVSAKDPCQGLYLFAVLPWYSRKKWRFHHQLCLSSFIPAVLKIQSCILCGWNGRFGGGEQTLPPGPAHPLSTQPARLPRVCCGGKAGSFSFSRAPLHMGIAHMWEEYSAWPIWSRLYKYSIPLDATGNTAKQPLMVLHANNLQIKTPPMCISTMGPALCGMGLWNHCGDNLGIKRL